MERLDAIWSVGRRPSFQPSGEKEACCVLVIYDEVLMIYIREVDAYEPDNNCTIAEIHKRAGL